MEKSVKTHEDNRTLESSDQAPVMNDLASYLTAEIDRIENCHKFSEILARDKTLNVLNKSVRDVALIAMIAASIDVHMDLALTHMFVVYDKVGMTSDFMHYLIRRVHPNLKIHTESTERHAKITVTITPSSEPQVFVYTIENASSMNLLGKKGAWSIQPKVMMKHRCMSQMARALFPHLLMGCGYTEEEILEGNNGRDPVINVTPDLDSSTTDHPKKVADKKASNLFGNMEPELYTNTDDQKKRLGSLAISEFEIKDKDKLRQIADYLMKEKMTDDVHTLRKVLKDWPPLVYVGISTVPTESRKGQKPTEQEIKTLIEQLPADLTEELKEGMIAMIKNGTYLNNKTIG